MESGQALTYLLQPWVNRLALQRQHAEDALVHPPQRFAPDESGQGLDAQGELAERQRPLRAQVSAPQPGEMLRRGVFRAVDDAEVFPAAALDRRLDQALAAPRGELQRLDHHALAAAVREVLPPR